MSERVKGTAIGIDLGTTYSCAAIWIGSNNRVEIIPNEQETGSPRLVFLAGDDRVLAGLAGSWPEMTGFWPD
ncbi:heat shock protein 70 family, peptide-binding domain protein [Artemisia annua]|uniref:Heat shock protein 70 family, peptide-binding domain protein n=1 Tax=Artemisia annua TaxID=35608 RepID=A0A2U1N2Z6_ARTAN|nr:heat shock protein 70 family, peptide-binding domain protein [Artemisia annua]